MLVSTVVQGSGGQSTYPIVSTATYKESLGFIPTASGDYNNLAMAPIDSLISPYAINQTGLLMPTLTTPVGIFNDAAVLNSYTLSPFPNAPSGTTNRIYTRGAHTYEQMNDDFNIGSNSFTKEKRVLGLKGPLILTGWGYDTSGHLTPSGVDYASDYSKFKTGPIDFLWDDSRQTWTSHDILNGVAEINIATSGHGSCRVYIKGQRAYVLDTYNFSHSTIMSGTNINLGYVATDNRWYALVGIPGSGGGTSSASGINVGDGINNYLTTDLTLAIDRTDPVIEFVATNGGTFTTLTLGLPDASPIIDAGVITNLTQDIGGLKSFTAGGTAITGDNAVIGTPSGWFCGLLGSIIIGGREGFSIVEPILSNGDGEGGGIQITEELVLSEIPEVDPDRANVLGTNFTVYGNLNILDGSGISNSTLNAHRPALYVREVGVLSPGGPFNQLGGGLYTNQYITDPVTGLTTISDDVPIYGITTRGGLVHTGSSSIGLSALPSGVDITSLLPPTDAAASISYTPGNSGDWSGDPALISDALDRLAAAVASLLGTPVP
jgi:hypothetical protein